MRGSNVARQVSQVPAVAPSATVDASTQTTQASATSSAHKAAPWTMIITIFLLFGLGAWLTRTNKVKSFLQEPSNMRFSVYNLLVFWVFAIITIPLGKVAVVKLAGSKWVNKVGAVSHVAQSLLKVVQAS